MSTPRTPDEPEICSEEWYLQNLAKSKRNLADAKKNAETLAAEVEPVRLRYTAALAAFNEAEEALKEIEWDLDAARAKAKSAAETVKYREDALRVHEACALAFYTSRAAEEKKRAKKEAAGR